MIVDKTSSLIFFILLSLLSFSCNSIFSCGYDDGTYSAQVYYFNPHTKFDNDYILDVEVSDCRVVKIIFPNSGYLDEGHISPAEIKDEKAHIEDDNGNTYDISLPEQGNPNDSDN